MQHVIISHYIAFFSHPICTPNIYFMGFIQIHSSCAKKCCLGAVEWEIGREERRACREKERFHYKACYGLVYFPINIGTHHAHAMHLVYSLIAPVDIHTKRYVSLDWYVGLWYRPQILKLTSGYHKQCCRENYFFCKMASWFFTVRFIFI